MSDQEMQLAIAAELGISPKYAPDYLRDLNAMANAEELGLRTIREMECYENELVELVRDERPRRSWGRATARQRAVALLKIKRPLNSQPLFKGHSCYGYTPVEEAGPALTKCFEYDDQPGAFWVSNGEYCSQVAYCPYCGAAAKVKPTVEPTGFFQK